MPDRSRKRRPADPNQMARSIAQEATADQPEAKEKNPAAVALGRLGGLKGGKARAEILTPIQRSHIARRAARARWKLNRTKSKS